MADPRLQYFLEFFQLLHRGELASEFFDNFEQAVQRTRERRKASVLTLQFTISPSPSSDDDAYLVAGKTSVKLPPVQRGEATFFVWQDGLLHHGRENQATLFGDPQPRLVSGTVIQRGESEQDAARATPQKYAPEPPPAVEVSDADFVDDRNIAL